METVQLVCASTCSPIGHNNLLSCYGWLVFLCAWLCVFSETQEECEGDCSHGLPGVPGLSGPKGEKGDEGKAGPTPLDSCDRVRLRVSILSKHFSHAMILQHPESYEMPLIVQPLCLFVVPWWMMTSPGVCFLFEFAWRSTSRQSDILWRRQWSITLITCSDVCLQCLERLQVQATQPAVSGDPCHILSTWNTNTYIHILYTMMENHMHISCYLICVIMQNDHPRPGSPGVPGTTGQPGIKGDQVSVCFIILELT